MTRCIFLVLLSLACAIACAEDAESGARGSLSPAQLEVLSAVERRWQAWADDDLDRYLSAHHPAWRRWSSAYSTLENVQDIPPFWRKAKDMEATLDFKISPVSVEIFEGGHSAAIHYVADERIRLLKDRTTPDGRVNPAGKERQIRIRFSDFLIRSKGRWLVIGGYRDGSCAMFEGFGKVCRD